MEEYTFVVIKPEALESGKVSEILEHISKICKDNGYSFEVRDLELTEGLLYKHYFGKGEEQVIKVGYKIKSALEEHGEVVDPDPQNIRMLGEERLEVQIKGYAGKQALIMKIVGDGSIAYFKKVKGSTDPAHAEEGTLRQIFSEGISLYDAIKRGMPVPNAVHVPDDYAEVKKDEQILWNSASSRIDLLRAARRSKSNSSSIIRSGNNE